MIINNLPQKIAVFPLSDAVFFPKTILPLNIFEKRYIQLVQDCLKDKRLFGMIQPKIKKKTEPEIYKVGCLGKIVNFNETGDGRFIINLSGIIRFRVIKEINSEKLYRQFMVDYSDFSDDLKINQIKQHDENKKKILNKIKIFFKKKNYFIDVNNLEKLNFDQLISTICMISPFSVEEKQKLIETTSTKEKIEIFENIINFGLIENIQNRTIQ